MWERTSKEPYRLAESLEKFLEGMAVRRFCTFGDGWEDALSSQSGKHGFGEQGPVSLAEAQKIREKLCRTDWKDRLGPAWTSGGRG